MELKDSDKKRLLNAITEIRKQLGSSDGIKTVFVKEIKIEKNLFRKNIRDNEYVIRITVYIDNGISFYDIENLIRKKIKLKWTFGTIRIGIKPSLLAMFDIRKDN